mgnify:CR=1 FL=1
MAFANQSRIEQTVEALAQFNATPGAGITRLSYTTEYRAAQAYLKQELEAAGLSVRLDPIGNLIGRKEGTDRSLAAIAVGSHLDSVRNGGKYDGAMGIICGLELARMMQEDNLSLQHPFEVIATVEEEGNSFSSGILGGKALVAYNEEHPDNPIVLQETYPSLEATIAGIENGLYDGYTHTYFDLKTKYLDAYPDADLEMSDVPLLEDEEDCGTYALLKKGNTDLQADFDAAIKALREEGKIAELCVEWFGEDYSVNPQ